MSYHVTTNEAPDKIRQYERQANKQDTIVLSILKQNWPASLSPSQVHAIYQQAGNAACPITSIRRALTNLTNDGLIYKTEVTVQGQYGRAEHTWKFINEYIPKQGVQMKLL